MAHIEKIRVKGNKYFRLVHNIRKKNKITHKTKYLGKKLPTKSKLEKMKREFLEELNKPKENKINKEVQKLKPTILKIIKKNGVIKAGIFGSYATGKQKKKSDIDILIQFDGRKRKSLLDLVGLEQELKEALGRKVDLVTYKGVSPYLKERISKEEVRIL